MNPENAIRLGTSIPWFHSTPKNRDQWVATRRYDGGVNGWIGASDVPGILGVAGAYNGPFTTWKKLIGEHESKFDAGHQKLLEVGHRIEDPAIDMLRNRLRYDSSAGLCTQVEPYQFTVKCAEFDRFRVTPDGIVQFDVNAPWNGVELKYTEHHRDAWREFGRTGRIEEGSTLERHWWQVQASMACTGVDRWVLAGVVGPAAGVRIALGIDPGDGFVVRVVERDSFACERIMRAVRGFWEYVEAGEEPPDVSAKDCAVLRSHYDTVETAKRIQATPDMVQAVAMVRAKKAMVKSLTAEIDLANAEIIRTMGDAEYMDLGEGVKHVTRKMGETKRTLRV